MSMTAKQGDNEAVLLEARDAGVLRLTLNRPAARNALSVGLMAALSRALDGAAADKACRVVVGHAHALTFFRFIAGMSSRSGFCAPCGCFGPA